MRIVDAVTLKAEFTGNFNGGYYTVPEIHALIDTAPTIDAAPVVHGYWDDSFDGITPFCSACHMSHRGFNRTPNYCPHCGAKMDLEGLDDHNGTD